MPLLSALSFIPLHRALHKIPVFSATIRVYR
ncbi:hypothetical protein BDSB_20420 [Burkholderia dolosa PC543]|nr:hypothetical protein BDSB_20420 [Burkholderia dolosa PC543]